MGTTNHSNLQLVSFVFVPQHFVPREVFRPESGLLYYLNCYDLSSDKSKSAYCTILQNFPVDDFRNTFAHNTWTNLINTSTKQNYSHPRNCPAIKNMATGTLMFQYFDCYYYDAVSTTWTLKLRVSLIEGRRNECHAKTLYPIPKARFHFLKVQSFC